MLHKVSARKCRLVVIAKDSKEGNWHVCPCCQAALNSLIMSQCIRRLTCSAHSLLNLQAMCKVEQHVRTTCVFRRMHPFTTKKPSKTLKKRNYVYIMEEDTNQKPFGNMDVLLTSDVAWVGLKGHVVTVPKSLGRLTLLPEGKAVYASPENIAEMEKSVKVQFNPSKDELYRVMTVQQLKGMHLRIPMNPNSSWTLNKTHVKIAFRLAGVEISEENIELPEEPVTEPTELSVKVNVNKSIPVEVKATLFHYNFDNSPYPADLPPLWSNKDSL